MKTLILDASGKTGKLVVEQLVKSHIQVRLVVRESSAIPGNLTSNKGIEIIKGNVNDFDMVKITELVRL